DIVVLAFERPDLALDEAVELVQIGCDVGWDVEIHGALPPANAFVSRSPAILRGRQVDAEAAAAILCRQANCIAAVAPRDLSNEREAEAAAAAAFAGGCQAIEGLENALAFAGWHARPVVAHVQHRSTAFPGDGHVDRAIAGISARILDEIAD